MKSEGLSNLEGKKIGRYEGRLFTLKSVFSNLPTLIFFLNKLDCFGSNEPRNDKASLCNTKVWRVERHAPERIQPMMADRGQEVRRSSNLDGKKIRRYEGRLFTLKSVFSNLPTLIFFLNKLDCFGSNEPRNDKASLCNTKVWRVERHAPERIQPMMADRGQEVRRSDNLDGKKIRRYEGKLFSVNSLSSNPPTLLPSTNHSGGNTSLIPTYGLKKRTAFTLAEGATHVAHFDYVRRVAFTLAEVLITLGIIGIVAALTMPSLIQNHKKSEASARLKKFYSTMSQAILLSENDNGSAKQWTKVDSIDKDPDTGLYDDADAENTEIYFNTYLKNYLKYLKTGKDENTNLFKVMLTDGSSFLMRNGVCIDIIFDYNGDKYPNKEGRDQYRFLICPANNAKDYANPELSLQTYSSSTDTTREARKYACKSNPAHCSGLLEYDNWTFKSDYPHRL